MVFCNWMHYHNNKRKEERHNPYFNRWFSAITQGTMTLNGSTSHNPYFNRWFSAIYGHDFYNYNVAGVTILILIDGFLQLGV